MSRNDAVVILWFRTATGMIMFFVYHAGCADSIFFATKKEFQELIKGKKLTGSLDVAKRIAEKIARETLCEYITADVADVEFDSDGEFIEPALSWVENSHYRAAYYPDDHDDDADHDSSAELAMTKAELVVVRAELVEARIALESARRTIQNMSLAVGAMNILLA